MTLQEFNKKQLRSCQLKQLAILVEIDKLCRRNGIEYWLDGGTLLGAVRHGGFIPWDDDIDIAMKADDLKRFEAIAPHELPPNLVLQSSKDDGNKEPITKVRDTDSLFIEPFDCMDTAAARGVYVDIFPFEPYPSVSRTFTRRMTRAISKSYSILHHPHRYSLRSAAEFFWFGAKYLVCTALWRASYVFNSPRSHYGNIPVNNGYGIKHRNDETWPLSTVTFEGMEFPAPKVPDAYLKELYGDYTALPPEDKRRGHAVFILPELA